MLIYVQPFPTHSVGNSLGQGTYLHGCPTTSGPAMATGTAEYRDNAKTLALMEMLWRCSLNEIDLGHVNILPDNEQDGQVADGIVS